MGEEVQESVTDALEQYIEQLRLQRSARLPVNLAPQQTCIYSMALFFHSASPRVDNPRPEFSARLQQRLLEQIPTEEQLPRRLQRIASTQPHGISPTPASVPTPTASPKSKKQFRNIFRHKQASQATHTSPTHLENRDKKKHQKQEMSRRLLFTSGTIAAGVAIGGGLEYLRERESEQDPTIVGKSWYPVATLDQLGHGPVPFTTATITGYLMHQTENGNPTGQVLAFSAACTHLGCIVQWQQDKQEFECPCHGSSFDAQGKTLSHYLSLPSLETRVDKDGIISVKAP